MNNTIFYIAFLFIGLINFTGFGQNSDAKMQELLQEKRAFNQTYKEVEGYRIQLYNGLSETRARSVLGTFSVFFPDIATHLFYEQPEWKVQTEIFRTKLEAYKTWLNIREEFEGTFIFENKE